MILDKSKRILVVGLGLIGGSYAAALKKNGFFVGAVDCSEKVIDYALKNNYIDVGRSDADAEYIGSFDIVVFALYPHTMLDWAQKYGSYIKRGALVTDVTGVKCCTSYRMQEILGEDVEFVGAHPMAGKESSGIENALPELFGGANYIVTPTEKNTPDGISLCEELGKAIGAGKISRLSPEKHDEMIGFLSQLTHCIAITLMACKDSQHLVDYTGDSFRDLTRIAKINEDMWSELFLSNRDELISQMELFLEHFKVLKNALESGDGDTIKRIMRISTERRKYFDK